jgi:hypothetical protein
MGKVKIDHPQETMGRVDINALRDPFTVKRVRRQGDRLSG